MSRYNVIVPADAPLWARQMQAQYNDALNRIALDLEQARASGFTGTIIAGANTVTVENGIIKTVT